MISKQITGNTRIIIRLFVVFSILFGVMGAFLSTIILPWPSLVTAAPLAQTDTGAKAVSAGGQTNEKAACVVMNTGVLRCWNTTQPPANLGPVSQVSVGFDHTCAIASGGALRCWGGNNFFGQTTVPTDLGPVSQVSTGNNLTCAISTAGVVRCWGSPVTGQKNVPTDLGSVSQISASIEPSNGTSGATCAVTTSGTVRCWSDLSDLVPADLGPAKQVSVGNSIGFPYACAVSTTGIVRCWSDMPDGALAVPTDLGPVSQISVGSDYICAITTTGTVRCWGEKLYGMTDPPSDLGLVSQISVGISHACAVTRAGGVRCWGSGNETLIPDPNLNLLSVSGHITDSSGKAVSGVTISDGTHTTMTDATGSYRLGSLGTGSYTLTPTKSGYTFNPPSRTVTVSADVSGQDFVATMPIYTKRVYLPLVRR